MVTFKSWSQMLLRKKKKKNYFPEVKKVNIICCQSRIRKLMGGLLNKQISLWLSDMLADNVLGDEIVLEFQICPRSFTSRPKI